MEPPVVVQHDEPDIEHLTFTRISTTGSLLTGSQITFLSIIHSLYSSKRYIYIIYINSLPKKVADHSCRIKYNPFSMVCWLLSGLVLLSLSTSSHSSLLLHRYALASWILFPILPGFSGFCTAVAAA